MTAASVVALAAAATAATAPISYSDLLARERPLADARIAYGQDPLQFGELWLPKGAGPHPVVAIIHGGCWRADLPGLELMDYAAADLRAAGKAVWNIEYRRIGHPGGGYPGTFLDVAQGLDHLKALAGPHRLDLGRAVVSGHSAGGHLAVWALARPRLSKDSPLSALEPVKLRGAVALAGIIDLEAYHADGPDACGGPGTIDAPVGAPDREGDVYADTSPPRLLPLGARQVIVSGDLDPIVPSRFGAGYGAAAKAVGDPATVIDLPAAGHFELIDPTAPAWLRIRAEIEALLD
ncbi:alpha/beta hydrolase [Phenylobacterium sp.]|uniref:alpha/beta hydrolase n=1 Tax=Phenylobacterium sp. TaxID=1871053 RepID=UPI002734AD78|nr:alpha/beta hydrolase [Phenylobacterium sp.]MDP3854834.1 alpha/beta hydrolase [Phenylobacterium sp.]